MTDDQGDRASVLHVVGARPNFMKVAPVMEALDRTGAISQRLLHTGQHYDPELSEHFFEDLGLPEPDVNLGVGSGEHAVQTGEIMIRIDPVLEELAPDWVFVVGDVNSTVAAALTAVKRGIRVAHVEAGLRSGDRSMPEEINRIVTDRLSDALFVTERSGVENLRREGVDGDQIHFVGNVMIDTLDRLRGRADREAVLGRLDLDEDGYVLVTLHRPGNVDDPERLRAALEALVRVRDDSGLPVVFPMHPRTRERVDERGLEALAQRIRCVEPLRYLDFLALMDGARAVVTDSGGIQEETTVLGVPCLTVRPNTERPVTVSEGTNRLYPGALEGLPDAVAERLSEGRRETRPELWDGRAAERIADVMVERYLSPAGGARAGASG